MPSKGSGFRMKHGAPHRGKLGRMYRIDYVPVLNESKHRGRMDYAASSCALIFRHQSLA
jgi:hypothetical protein